MSIGNNITTYFEGRWHKSDVPIMRAADHGSWLGTTVFDGARFFAARAPDLVPHCARVNRSAEALMIRPTVSTEDMVDIVREGLKHYGADDAVYIRPMYWAIHGDATAIMPDPDQTGFAISLEQIPMAPADAAATLGHTRFRRPVMEDNVVNAKAGCLYPNNARMLSEVRSRGFSNALVADAMGNVAESATANIFMVKDGEAFTPIANGTFLSGITRARHISNMKADGITVHEKVLTFDDFHQADEVFMTGNMSKITPVKAFEETQYQVGPLARRLRDMYWDWAASEPL